MLRFSGSYLATARLPRLLQPTLNRLAVQTGESLSAVVLDGSEVVIVARSVNVGGAHRVLAYGLHLGARLPAHATSTGRVLLAALLLADFNAWLNAALLAGGGALARLTAHTVIDEAPFKALIRQVRADDFCVAHEEHELGVHALAVPLRDLQGRTVAAINVVADPQRLAPGKLAQDLLPTLQDAARELRPLL